MDDRLDLWSGCAVFVSVVAIFVWLVSTTLETGDTWVPWAAAGVIILAMGSVGVRAWVKAKDVVWTGELRAGQRRRAYQMIRETIPIFLLALGLLVYGAKQGVERWRAAAMGDRDPDYRTARGVVLANACRSPRRRVKISCTLTQLARLARLSFTLYS